MEVMLGSMNESTIGSAAIAHLAPLADHLDMEQLDARLTSAYQAQSAAELQRIIADLPALPIGAVDPGAAAMVPNASVPARGVMMAFMGASVRKGSWVVPRHLKVVAFWAGVELDLREARFGPGVTEIDVAAVMAGVEVTVPPGVRVEVMGGALMGGFEADTGNNPGLDASQPVLRLTGLAVMAGVEVSVRRPDAKMLERFDTAWKAARLSSGN